MGSYATCSNSSTLSIDFLLTVCTIFYSSTGVLMARTCRREPPSWLFCTKPWITAIHDHGTTMTVSNPGPAISSSFWNQFTWFFLGHWPPSYSTIVVIPLLQGWLSFCMLSCHHVAQLFDNDFHAPMPSYHFTSLAPCHFRLVHWNCSLHRLFNFKVCIAGLLLYSLFSCLWLPLTAIRCSNMPHFEFTVSCSSLEDHALEKNLQEVAIPSLNLVVGVVQCDESSRWCSGTAVGNLILWKLDVSNLFLPACFAARFFFFCDGGVGAHSTCRCGSIMLSTSSCGAVRHLLFSLRLRIARILCSAMAKCTTYKILLVLVAPGFVPE